jgi:chromosome segregation ATPase
LHEREIAEYKMKLHSFESEVDKLTTRLHRALAEKDRLESRLESSGDLGKSRRGYDRDRDLDREYGRGGADSYDSSAALNQKISRLEIENDRLRAELERSQVKNIKFS